MKSLANGLITFVISLLIGITAAWFFFGEVPAVDAVNKRVELREVATPEVEKNVVFKPEFTRLPSYAELDFPELPDNFIDLYNTDGLLRRSEVLAKTGEKWLVMSEAFGGYRITPTVAKVKQLKSVSYPGDENDAQLSFPGTDKPIFAFRGIPGIKQGSITTLYLQPTSDEISRRNLDIKSMETGFKRQFNLNENWFTLRVSDGETQTGKAIGVLVLENNGTQQIVARNYYEPGHGTIIGDLLWTGDIDNDGKLDLYIDEFNEKGYFRGTLFLSSHAKNGELVGLAASFGYAGC